MPIHHGIKITETGTGTRPITTASTSVIGLVALASDATADAFPLNTLTLVTDAQAAVSKAGVAGSLAKSLQAIADQCSPIVVVIRVADGVASEGVTVDQATEANIIAGLQALAGAPALLGVKPTILGVPGFDSQAVAAELVITAQKLRGMAYAQAVGDDIEEAITYRDSFSAREIMLIWPDFTGFSGDAVARALGLRAKIDTLVGWHKSISNYGVNGVTGISKSVFFDMSGVGTDAALLNDAPITTLIRNDGFKFWGNRTCSDDPQYAFEVSVRTNYVLQDTIAKGLEWAIDKPLTAVLVKDIVETVNAAFRSLVQQGFLIGARAWYDPAKNSQTNLAGGKLAISYDFTPCAPLESLNIDSSITDTYYANLADQLAA